MNFFYKYRTVIISIIVIVVLIGSVFLWNFIVDKQKKQNNESTVIDPLEVNNVTSVDGKLNGEDYKISQLYLLSYSKHKSGIWYMSKAYISNIKIDSTDAIITLKEDKNSNIEIKAIIDSNKVNVKTGNIINFVGTIDIKSGNIYLSKISLDEINYASVTEITFNELYNNIKKIKETYFIIRGYMITDKDKYKLFDSKDEYNKDSSSGRYFLLNWKEEFMYTGNQDVTVRCQLVDTYSLGNCELVEK